MCMFAGPPVKEVSQTRIFAGARPDGQQVLVYDMKVVARSEVAMILPVPVPPDPGDDALRFIDLSDYRDLFSDLDGVFEPLYLLPPLAMGTRSNGGGWSPPPLRVHAVGAFEASFVPTRADFDRLDPRFVLPDAVWEARPEYRDWGFAVFQLVDVARQGWWARLWRRAKRIHPMAFVFPRRDPQALYYPTVHVHDGALHEQARFDHRLFAQLPGDATPPAEVAGDWARNALPLSTRVSAQRAGEVLDVERPCWRRLISGMQPNRDVWLRHCRQAPEVRNRDAGPGSR